jgi:PKD repeat protein
MGSRGALPIGAALAVVMAAVGWLGIVPVVTATTTLGSRLANAGASPTRHRESRTRPGRLTVVHVIRLTTERTSRASRAAVPAVTPSPPFSECPAIGADTSCGLLLDVINSGVTVLEDSSQGPYDGSDDTLVGVVNQSSTTLANLTLESTTPIFAFDGDGICSGFYGSIAGCPFGPTGYEGPETSFVQISPNLTTGAVSFTNGVAPGGTAYFSLEEPLTASTVTTPKYVALGDSVAAGEGIGYGWHWNATKRGWEGGSDSGTWDSTFEPEECHQTPEGYPHVAATELGASLTDFACTGASAFNGVLGERVNKGLFGIFGNWSAPAQLGSSIGLPETAPPNPEYDAAEPGLVSFTLGADDVHFSDIVKGCYTGPCNTDPHSLDRPLAEVAGNLSLVLDEIHRRGVADGRVPLVVVTEYYNPYPAYDWSCHDINAGYPIAWLSKEQMDFLVNGLYRLDHTIAQVAAKKHVLTLNMDKLLEKHRFCSPNTPWIYGPSILLTGFPPDTDSQAPFHPTPEGQEAIGQALTKLVANKLPVNTGSNVHVGLPNGSLDFANVASAGEAAIIPSSDLPGSVPPANTFALASAYEIATSAEYSGNITVSLPSTTALSLFHYVEGEWQEVPSTFNGSFVSGEVMSLSPFALGTPVSPVHARLASVTGGEAPDAVRFDASGSSVADGSGISSYQWDFGDEQGGFGATPTHVYIKSGTYTVTVTVTAEDGAVDVASQEVTITHSSPHAVLVGPTSGTVGQTLSFDSSDSSASNGSIVGALWEFGDGSEPVSGSTTSHAFPTPGTYQIKLTVRDEEGAADSVSLPVTVAAGATASIILGGTSSASGGTLPSKVIHLARVTVERTVRRDRRGRLVVTLRCAAGSGTCAGTLKLRTLRHKKLVTLGGAHYSIAAGKAHGIAVRITRALAQVARTPALSLSVLVVEASGMAIVANARTASPSRLGKHHR